jgi:polyisoprenyl-phosphate glycosyltransferase
MTDQDAPRNRKLISIVTPLYNESANVDELARRLAAVFDQYQDRYDFEVIAVENGSADDTYEKLLAVRARDARWKVIQLSRNFLMEGGMTAGLSAAQGDAAVIMASDLQDPPELIPRFIEKWEEGYENIFQVINRRPDESRFRRFCAAAFYRIINAVSDTPVPRNASDFRLVDRLVYQAFNGLGERNRMVRAMWGFLGFRSCGIEAERAPRHGGRSSYNFLLFAAFAMRGILSSSNVPLKAIPFFGAACAAFSFVILAGVVVRAYLYGVPFDGFGTITGLMLMLFGFLFLLLGLVSEYVGMIYNETRRRPSFIVRATHGFERSD